MEPDKKLRIEISYDAGLEPRLLADGPLPAAAREALKQQGEVQWMPSLEALPVLIEALEEKGLELELSSEAQALRALADALVEQDDRMHRWISGELGPQLPLLHKLLSPHQLQAAAFLAFRGRAMLADPRALEPIVAAVAACRILRVQRAISHVVIVSPESRHHLWLENIDRLTDAQAEVVAGTKRERQAQYESAPFYTLIAPEELTRDRKDLAQMKPMLLVLDEVPRYWHLGKRSLEAVRRLDPMYIAALSSADPMHNPEGLFSVISLLYPEVAGPRLLWDNLYLDRSQKGVISPIRQSDLALRVHSLLLRRSRTDLGDVMLPPSRETHIVPLTRMQRSTYERAQKSLLSILKEDHPTLPQQRRADEALATMRECVNGMSLCSERSTDSSKLDELRYILEQEVGLAGHNVVIFTRWEAMSRAIAAVLKQLKINHVRHYHKLPSKRREGLVERFGQEPELKVFLSTDTSLEEGVLKAELLIHFDMPWDPALLTWRRTRLMGTDTDELILLAADTLEEGLHALPRPVIVPADLPVGEEDAGVPMVHLYFSSTDEHRVRLRQLLHLDEAPMIDRGSEAAAEEAQMPAEEAQMPVEEAQMPVEAAQMPAETAQMPVEAAQMPVEAAQMPAETAQMPAEEAHAPASPAETTAEAPSAMGSEASSEEAHPAEGAASEAESAAPRPSGAAEDTYWSSYQHSEDAGGGYGEGKLGEVLQQIEVPLKAANRLLSGVPVVGETLSHLNAQIWDSLTSSLRTRR